jgi:uncharacterized protein (DUF4415 family)
MTEKELNITSNELDQGDVKPTLDDDWFAEADAYQGAKLVRRGRPRSDNPKMPVTIRLDRDLVDWFKRGGVGWQTRMNEELRKAVGI